MADSTYLAIFATILVASTFHVSANKYTEEGSCHSFAGGSVYPQSDVKHEHQL
jgi:hypothetical protein